MPAFRCPKHGMQIASCFCEHAARAVDERTPEDVFIRRDQWGWYTLCRRCALLPKEQHDANSLVCGECVVEWAKATDSNYLERCVSPVEEYPVEEEP